MMGEKEYVIQTFKKNFSEYREKNIVIYGIGPNTKAILDECRDYNIVALMDATMEGEVLWDKKIIKVSELDVYGAELIVIVARHCNVGIIYERIADYCNKIHLPVYSINGNCLQMRDAAGGYGQFQVNKEKLIDLIMKNDVISMDIFDTLIMRKTLYPIDVFEIVENKAERKGIKKIGFAKLRVESERILNMEMVPDVYDIYEKMKEDAHLDETTAKQYMELELETEKEVLVVRKEMKEILDKTVEGGKKVYLISDMYWPAKVLENILEELNVKGYEKILVSCEYRETKGTTLFQTFKEMVQGKSYLHIGDNYDVDFLMAERNGINAYHILSAYEMLKISEAGHIVQTNRKLDLSSRCMVGFFIAKAFSNPFLFDDTNRKVVVTCEKDFGYMFLGAIMTQYILWLCAMLKSKSGTVFFTARDGYILKELYDEYVETTQNEKFPESEYFLTSRMCSLVSGVTSEEDIIYASNMPFSGTMKEMLERRFMLVSEEIKKRRAEETDVEYLMRHRDEILKKSRLLQANYKKYLNRIYRGQAIYWVDFVSSGTCQYYFEKEVKKSVQGFYFHQVIVEDEKKQKLDICSLYNPTYAYEEKSWLIRSYIFLENVFTSYLPTLQCMDTDGEPIYWTEKRTEKYLEGLKEIHQGIREYFREFISLDLPESNFVEISDSLIGCMHSSYSQIEIDFLKDNVLEDEFAKRLFDAKKIIREE